MSALYIIAGHIGRPLADPGAVSPAGWTEAEFVGRVGGLLAAELGARRLPCVLDMHGGYTDRASRADVGRAGLVLHLHADAVAAEIGPDISGVYYWPGSARGQVAAESCAAALSGCVPWPTHASAATQDKYPRPRSLLALTHTPALVVELGFTDGAQGRVWLPAHAAELARTLADWWVHASD